MKPNPEVTLIETCTAKHTGRAPDRLFLNAGGLSDGITRLLIRDSHHVHFEKSTERHRSPGHVIQHF